MAKIAMAVDLDYCVGCFACESACKMVNNLPDGTSWLKVHPRDIVSEEYLGTLVMDRFPIPITVEMCINCRDLNGCDNYNCNNREKNACSECPERVADHEPVCATACVGQALFVGNPERASMWAAGRRTAMFIS